MNANRTIRPARRTVYLSFICALVIGFSAGCSTDESIPQSPSATNDATDRSGVQGVPTGPVSGLAGADLTGSVVLLAPGGFVVRPDIVSGGGQVSEQALDDDSNDRTIDYTETTRFQIVEISTTDYSEAYHDATAEDVKIGASIYLWCMSNGTHLTATRVVIARYIQDPQ